MYKKSGEFVDHVLVHCEFACHLWSLVFCLFVFHWDIHERVWDLLACWKGSLGSHQSADLWGAVALCIMWTIWRECSRHIFEEVEHIVGFEIYFLMYYV